MGSERRAEHEDEEEMLVATVRAFVDRDVKPTVREVEHDNTYPEAWIEQMKRIGIYGLAIPEEFGGSGFTYVELTVVLEEMGAALLCAPFFSTVALAANALLTSGDDEAKKAHLPGIVKPVLRQSLGIQLMAPPA